MAEEFKIGDKVRVTDKARLVENLNEHIGETGEIIEYISEFQRDQEDKRTGLIEVKQKVKFWNVKLDSGEKIISADTYLKKIGMTFG